MLVKESDDKFISLLILSFDLLVVEVCTCGHKAVDLVIEAFKVLRDT